MIVFLDGAIPARDPRQARRSAAAVVAVATRSGDTPGRVPRLARVASRRSKTIPQLKEFLEDGGTIITIGSSTNLAYHLGLPVIDKLVETTNGQERALPREKFYVPGSVLQVDGRQHAAGRARVCRTRSTCSSTTARCSARRRRRGARA